MPSQSESKTQSKDSSLIQSVYVQPDIRRGRITVHVDAVASCSLQLAVPELGISVDGAPGKSIVPMDEFRSWTPETPKTYELICTATDSDNQTHSCTIGFGMREFSVKEKRFFFNNRPLYIKGADCSGIRGDSVATDEERADITACFESLVRAGFNLLRVSVSTLTEDLLAIADEVGLLVEVELRDSSELDIVVALRNHPSVVIWNALTLNAPVSDTLRETDPSRVYLYADSETGEPRCSRPYRDDDQPIEILSVAHQAPTHRRSQSYCQHMGDGSTVSYVARLSLGRPILNKDDTAALDDELAARELSKIIPGGEALVDTTRGICMESLQCLVDSIRTNGNVAGYCVGSRDGADTDSISISEAILNTSRLTLLGPSQMPTRPLITIAQNNLTPRQETPIKVHLLNEDKLEGRADLSLQVVGPTNQVLWKKKRGVRLPKSGRLIWEGDIAASGSTGKHRFVVRIMQNFQMIAEASVDFFVYPPSETWDGTVNLLDPGKRWAAVCSKYVSALEFKSPMHIIPPIVNSIRAFPDNDLAQILGQVNEGAVAMFFQPPKDWNDFARFIDPELQATSAPSNTTNPALVHYAKSHPVFDSLPSRTVMEATYGQLMPSVTFLESSEEDICGCYRGSSSEKDERWGSNILVKKYGSGRMVFISLPIMEQLGHNPVADHLFVNLIKHFARRSVPSQEGSFAVHQRSVEWIRQQRQDFTQNWSILGMFPWSPENAKAPVYPPETSIDLNATYPGWYRALTWKSWFSREQDDYMIDLDEALGPEFAYGSTSDHGIAYAYAEVIGETRGEMRLTIEGDTRMEVYMNGALVYSPDSDEEDPTVYMKLGKNTVLVKLYKTSAPFGFKLDFDVKKDPVKFRWWK